MKDRASITVSLPDSLRGRFQAVAADQAITVKEACRRIICGLSGLTDTDLRSLREPPREYRNTDLKIDLEWRYLDRLTAVSRASEIRISSIFRRILHALLITRRIHFIAPNNKDEFRLELRQTHFVFAEDYERDGPIPLLSRQHRDDHDPF
jgi:hypothetical protein